MEREGGRAWGAEKRRGPGSGCRDPEPWTEGQRVPSLPRPLSVSPQWFKRPQAAAERMPGAPPPAPSRARGAGCGTAVGAGRPGRGAGRGDQHRGQLPRRSAQPQQLGAALTPSGPRLSGRCAAAVPPLHSWRPRAPS